MSTQEIMNMLENAVEGTEFWLFRTIDFWLLAGSFFILGVSVGITIFIILENERKKRRRKNRKGILQ